MDSIQETPAKRRKLDNGTAQSQGYDSQNDSGDEIFDDYNTVATIPVSVKPAPRAASDHILSSPPAHITQPTQLIGSSTPRKHGGTEIPAQIQVPASSPAASRPSPAPLNHRQGGSLASSMAPAGTAFRLPMGVKNAPTSTSKSPAIVDISDDDLPTYNGSSDDDSQTNRRADIKPSTFISSAPKRPGSDNAQGSQDRFKAITAKSFYKPVDKGHHPQPSAPNRSADTLANAYGGTARPSRPKPRQNGPSKALPAEDMNIIDVADFQLRSKILRIRQILPQYGVRACKGALEIKRYNFDDAVEYLAAREGDPTQIDLTISDGENPANAHSSNTMKAPAKQQVKVKQNIQEKWTATQSLAKEARQSQQSQVASPPVAAPSKPKRRLIQGRRQPSSPIAAPTPPPKQQSQVHVSSPARSLSFESDASDSGVGSEPDTELDSKVLGFFNTCSPLDLADIAMITSEVAGVLLSQRPFDSLDDVRQVSSEVPPKSTKTTKKKSSKKPIGDKIVDKCLEMWTGYEAVDSLVKKCDDISKPLKADMQAWGMDAFGASTDGEFDLTSFSRDVSPRDSGIGTPSSHSVSEIDDLEARKQGKRPGVFSQPAIMAENVKLKDYQVVGINWLSLLFNRKLSCILADDMGLGKTCQVIAFLAHLLERGVKGPHLIIVPGSTLENWLREFSVFCPQLQVMPYYAAQNERPGIQDQILASRDTLNVVVTTYTLAKQKEDNRFLRKLRPVACVFDEGHLLKNSKSAGYEAYMRIPSDFRLLLTGTPLQNNLKELTSLLGFILPSLFKDHSEDLEAIFSHKAKTSDDSHAALLSEQRIARAKSIMTPFVLRRKKHQVLKHLPEKTRRVEYCDLSATQAELYNMEKSKALRIAAARAAGEKTGTETSNVMMALRKASIHPLLFRRLYDDKVLTKMSKAIIKEEQYHESSVNLVYEDMEVMTDMELHRLCEANTRTMNPYLLRHDEWMDSGKVGKLTSLLKKYKANGDRVLVFSQFTMVMDILEYVMETLGLRFFRLDGRTNINERQTMIDQFYEEKDITVFLLSTKAGGAGINLACSNKVVIFDSSFNPQDDIQAGK